MKYEVLALLRFRLLSMFLVFLDPHTQNILHKTSNTLNCYRDYQKTLHVFSLELKLPSDAKNELQEKRKISTKIIYDVSWSINQTRIYVGHIQQQAMIFEIVNN